MAGEPRVWEVDFLLLSVGTLVRATKCEGKSEVKAVSWAARSSVEWGSSVRWVEAETSTRRTEGILALLLVRRRIEAKDMFLLMI